jgi:hypothetical protein
MFSIVKQSLRLCLVFGLVLPTYAGIIFDPTLNTCGSPAPGTANPILADVIALANAALNFMNGADASLQSSNNMDHWNCTLLYPRCPKYH